MAKLQLWAWACHQKADFFGKDNNAGQNRRQQEKKRKTDYEVDRLHKSHRHESIGTEQSR